MPTTTLEALVATARTEGWAAGAGTLEEIRSQAAELDWTETPMRRGDPPVSKLRPLSRAAARPNSLSSRYGMGGQPLHTDGAHLEEPPDVVVLASTTTSQVPTRLWKKIPFGTYVPGPIDLMTHGVFLVANGRDSFFATAHSGSRYRYDPGCMTPCDERARQAAAYFGAANDEAIDFFWDEPGKLLVINNRLTLHARAAADQEPERELERVAFRGVWT
ncbi:MAG: hypothetical protein HOW97_14500 [Catenulispora sp.]|nr:hypothetical protein [Catenulispora sp.]